MPPTNKSNNSASQKGSTGKSSSTLSDPKTPVLAKGAAKPPVTSKGRPRKKSAKENVSSPLGGATSGATPGQLTATVTGDDEPTTGSVAEENRILRERLAKAECEWDIPFSQ